MCIVHLLIMLLFDKLFCYYMNNSSGDVRCLYISVRLLKFSYKTGTELWHGLLCTVLDKSPGTHLTEAILSNLSRQAEGFVQL